MLNQFLNTLKAILDFLKEKPGARIDWTWPVDAPHLSYGNSLTNQQAHVGDQAFHGLAPKSWIPAHLNYYGNSSENEGERLRQNTWTSDKLIQMSNFMAQSSGTGLTVWPNDLNTEH
ncbi:MAG: hypothetical protein VKJ02_18225 [Snowella sp.]|nr:hypothetical protein [Snowella sp.]